VGCGSLTGPSRVGGCGAGGEPGNISERLPDLVISLAAHRLAEIPPCISTRRAPNSRRSEYPRAGDHEPPSYIYGMIHDRAQTGVPGRGLPDEPDPAPRTHVVDKENDRVRKIVTLNMQTGPALLADRVFLGALGPRRAARSLEPRL
jgi:hypothetical protein